MGDQGDFVDACAAKTTAAACAAVDSDSDADTLDCTFTSTAAYAAAVAGTFAYAATYAEGEYTSSATFVAAPTTKAGCDDAATCEGVTWTVRRRSRPPSLPIHVYSKKVFSWTHGQSHLPFRDLPAARNRLSRPVLVSAGRLLLLPRERGHLRGRRAGHRWHDDQGGL